MLKAMRPMTLFGCAFASACVMWLSGCDNNKTSPATSSDRAVTSPMTAPIMPPLAPPLVPPALPSPTSTDAAALPPNAAENEPTTKATDGVRRPAQATDDQPVPGQNNDHSAPLSPAK